MKTLKAFLRRLLLAIFWIAASPAILFGIFLLSAFILVLWAFESPNQEITKEEYYGRWL